MEAKMETRTGRQIAVAGMAYAPTNEQGVVLLFGRLAPRLGFCVEQVQTHCPDCTARRRGQRYRIEFEYWASHYAFHRHPCDAADIIVCWENDWEIRPSRYKHLEIIDLKQYAGALPRVFVVGCNLRENAEELRARRVEWNVPVSAQIGDLVLMYRAMDTHGIHDAWEVVGPFNEYGKRNKEGRWPGLQAYLRCVVRLHRPIEYAELKRDPTTRNLGVVKGRFRGKQDITHDWPLIRRKIVELNPKARVLLAKYGDEE
jgi:hypothetical protein